MRGKVKAFSDVKGWGFIAPDGQSQDVFVHFKNIRGTGFRTLRAGEAVEFTIVETPRGPAAEEVESLFSKGEHP